MQGFLGSVERDAIAAERVAAWMKQWIALHPAKASFELNDGPFAYLASQEPDDLGKPMAKHETGIVLVFFGFIAHDQLSEAGAPLPRTNSEVAAALLRRYLRDGAESLAALNGRYLIAVWNPREESLELMNDLMGLKPVFLWQKGNSLIFSSNLWPAACHPGFRGEIEPKAIADLLLLSHQQGQRTLLKEVSMLPPGAVTRFCAGCVTSRPVRNLKFSDERWTWSIPKIADAMYDVLWRSCARRVRDGSRVRLPLSGGLDSRVVLGILRKRPVEVHPITQYQHGLYGLDAKYAQRLARAAGLPIEVVPLYDAVFARYRKKCVAINGGTYDIHTGRFLSLVDQARERALPTVSSHLGGEITSRFQIPDVAFKTPDEHYAAAFKSMNSFRFSPDRVRRLISDRLPRSVVDEVLEENRAFFFSCEGSFFHRYYNWDLMLTRRRYISYQVLYFEQYAEVATPFYDRDVLDFFCSLPFAAIEGQRAYLEMIATKMPNLARIPNSNTDKPVLPSTKEVLKDFIGAQYRRFIQRPLRKALRLRMWVGHPMEQMGYALLGDSRDVVDHILSNTGRLEPYLKPDEVRAAIRRLEEKDFADTMGILGLSAFLTTLEFVEDPHAAIRAWQE